MADIYCAAEIDDYGLDVYEFRLLHRIARRGGQKGCWESERSMSEGMRIGRNTLRKAKSGLVQKGMIRDESVAKNKSVLYLNPIEEWARFNIDIMDASGSNENHHTANEGGSNQSQNGSNMNQSGSDLYQSGSDMNHSGSNLNQQEKSGSNQNHSGSNLNHGGSNQIPEGNPLNKSIKVKDTTPISPSSSKTLKKEKVVFGSDAEIPDFVNPELWDAMMEIRQRNKSACTDRALSLLLNKLKRLHEAGEDVNACLENSIIGGWKDVYPSKPDKADKRPALRTKDLKNIDYNQGTEGFNVV